MKIALVYNWPGNRNAEFDLIGRMQHVFADDGHSSIIIDPFGHPITASGELCLEQPLIDATEYDLCLNLHHSTPQFLDCFSYLCNWNPVDYIIRDPASGLPTSERELSYLAACFAAHDVVLSAGSETTDLLISALADRPDPSLLFPDLSLHTTCQWDTSISPVSLDGFRVFYIGVNWERTADLSRSAIRHGGLLERLDQSGRVDFYGVEKINSIKPWEGFHHYRGELPFDNGRSIIRTSNKCGVSLVLSSRPHRDSSLVSTRIFQACAARTVIISDDNPFIVEHFGNTVLTFEYSSDPETAYNRVMTLIAWIEQHPEQALEKAEQAHLIFVQRFSLNQELRNLLSRHHQTLAHIHESVLPVDRLQTVDVIYHITSFEEQALDTFITNLNRQQEVQPHAIVYLSSEVAKQVSARLEQHSTFCFTVVPQTTAARTTGASVLLAINEHAQGESFCIYQPETIWHRYHIAFLLRVLQNGSSLVSQTHLFIRNKLVKEQAYNRPLAEHSVAKLELLRPDHLAERQVGSFSASAFLFHRKLLLNHVEQARNIQLYDHSAYFFLLLLNYIEHRTLPESTSRITMSRERNDELFTIHDLNDTVLYGRLQTEITTLGMLFRQHTTTRELTSLAQSSAAAFPERTKNTIWNDGMYTYITTILHKRPVLLRVTVVVYNCIRFLLRVPPYPPKSSK